MMNLSLIPYLCGHGATKPGCGQGARALKDSQLAKKLHAHQLHAVWESFYQSPLPSNAPALELVEDYCRQLSEQVETAIRKQHFPVALGGDHSMAIGSWAGVARAYDAVEQCGLIWVDAHMDAHTLFTSPSGAYHGMPVACLLGEGEALLTRIGNEQGGSIIAPHHLCLIGVRSYEPEEAEFLESAGVKIYPMDEVRKRGLQTVLNEAVEQVSTDTKCWGLTFDLDALDPVASPGVGTPEPGGFHREETLAALSGLAAKPGFTMLEIAEYNPTFDHDHLTSQLVAEMIAAVFGR